MASITLKRCPNPRVIIGGLFRSKYGLLGIKLKLCFSAFSMSEGLLLSETFRTDYIQVPA